MPYNRYTAAVFYKRTGADRAIVSELNPLGIKQAYEAVERQDKLPLDINCTIYKSITTHPDTATVQIKNALQIEQIYEQNAFFFEDFSQNHYELEILTGYLEGSSLIRQVFTGDITGVNITGGDNLTDQSLTFHAVAGFNAFRHGSINKRFDAGTTYREIILHIFNEVWLPQFGIELKEENIVDPDGILETPKLRSFTANRPGERILSDISRGIDQKANPKHFGFMWGIGAYDGVNRQAYFIDKRAIFDLAGDNKVKRLTAETGRIGRIGYGKDSFSFDHFPDTNLNIGNEIITSDFPAVNSTAEFKGRINSIRMNLSNKGENRYSVNCAFVGDDGFAVLNANRAQVSGYSH